MSENDSKTGDIGKAAGEGLVSIGEYGKELDKIGKELDKVNGTDTSSGTAKTKDDND